MIREYKTVEEIVSPLMMVRMVENVTYNELVEVELHDGTTRRALWQFPHSAFRHSRRNRLSP